MHTSGLVALLASSFAVLGLAAALKLVAMASAEKNPPRLPLPFVVMASIVFGTVSYRLEAIDLAPSQMVTALTLTVVLLGGILLKWAMETIAQKKFVLHEKVLAMALLVAPLTTALLPAFAGPLGLRTILLWMLTGYAWHSLLSDIERIVACEPVIIRRREPPTLPYDFRRPQGN